MAIKVTVLVLLASFLLLSTRAAYDTPASVPPAQAPAPHIIIDTKECIGACEDRCSLHSRKNVCKRACNTCCSVCKCVPSGTVGNKETCGKCYTDWTTHGNKTKCP